MTKEKILPLALIVHRVRQLSRIQLRVIGDTQYTGLRRQY